MQRTLNLLLPMVALSLSLWGCQLDDDGVADGGLGPTSDGALVDGAAMDAGPAADVGPDPDPPNGEPAPVRGVTEAHNVVRARTQAAPALPPLVWDPDVAAFSQEWADELVRRGCGLEHRPREGEFQQRYGENLFAGSGDYSATEVVEAWASEVADYNYADNSCAPDKACGHYTQIVWRDSARVGCAIGRCPRWTVWVCNYDPPGNFIGRKPY